MKGKLLAFFVVICDDQGGYLVNCYIIVVREFSTVGVATNAAKGRAYSTSTCSYCIVINNYTEQIKHACMLY